MTKKWVLAVALLSLLAISLGCRNVTGVSKVKVVVSDGNLGVLYVGQQVTFTATVTGTSNTAVTWSLSSTGCTGSACGTLSSSGLYTAPATSPGNKVAITITATSQADSTASGSWSVYVDQITVQITPSSANVGINLTQQFTAVAVPDDARQTFTWSPPTCTTAPCGTIVPDGNNPGLAVYHAPPSPSPTNDVKFIVTSTVDTTGFSQATVTVVNSRLGGNSKQNTTYAFRFSGFNILGATALVGNFVVSAADGQTIVSGVEDELTSGGPKERTLTGLYTPTSNNQGTITLNPSGGVPQNTYTVVLDANGDLQMIESDGNGTGSGVIEQVTGKFQDQTSLSGNFVFGFTGADVNSKRVGYAGFLPMDGAGNIGTAGGGTTPGLIDINDDGTASSATDVTGHYSMSGGIGTMTLTSATLGKTFHFNLYGVSGQTKASNPLTAYAISTDGIATNPAVSGTVVFQDPNGSPYNNATFKNTSVVSLTGVDSTGTNSNVSLTVVTTDGSGNLNGSFDQNNGGTIVDVGGPLSSPPSLSFSTGYTYSATAPTGSGRYTFMLLGNPNASPVVPPVTFVLYASGANRGFLLDQSSPSVMTGTMALQTVPKGQQGIFSASNLPGTYAAATTSSATTLVCPIAANLLLTWVDPTQGVSGTQYQNTPCAPGSATVTGAYTLQGSGYGTITLTAPSAASYAIYAIDVTHLLVMDMDKANANASIIYAQQ